MRRKPWIMYLPIGLREQAAWVFIGCFVGLVGLSYLTGLADSNITRAIGPTGLRVWGGGLALSGFGVAYATLSARPALERLALRCMSLGLLAYAGWVLTVIDFKRAVMTIALAVILIGMAEIRSAYLKMLFVLGERRYGE